MKFTSITSVGLVAGESTAKPLLQLTGGFSYNRYFLGIGGGIDPYLFDSYPLFADARMSLGKDESVFVYGNAGYNFTPRNSSRNEGWFNSYDRFYGGFYMDAGIGYKIRLSNAQNRLLFSAGYSRKSMVNKISQNYMCITEPCPEYNYKYSYDLGRVVAKFSWEFCLCR